MKFEMSLSKNEINKLTTLLETGTFLANVAYNLKQKEDIPKDDRKLLEKWQQSWDENRKDCAEILHKFYLVN